MPLRPKILAVDDEPTNLVIIEEVLGDEYDVTMLSDGQATLDIAKRLKPALVLLDITMPVVNGYDLCRMLRAERTLKHLKVVLVSANASIEERVRGYEAGADDYIVKPISPDEFRAKVRVFLRLKSVEEVDEFRSRLLTLLGHELRTPLAEIFAPAEMLSVQGSMSDADRRKLAGIIFAGATRLRRFIERATFLASIRGGQVSMECVATDCVPLIHQAINSAHDRLAARRCNVEIEGPSSLISCVHPGHLFTIFDSLLDNAIRFSRREDSIRILVGSDPMRPFVAFIDHGAGIDADRIATLFDGLNVPDIKHHSSEQGLSLAIAHGLISAMGGDLSVESRPGCGSEFRVTLPLVQQSVGALR